MAYAVWTPLAENDLEGILFQIRVVDERPLTARRNGEAIHNAVNARASMDVPGRFTRVLRRAGSTFASNAG